MDAAGGGAAAARLEAAGAASKIRFAGVEKTYATRRGAKGGTLALDRFDLDIQPSEIMSIAGPTGCGKSTALNVLAGFEEPSSGSVTVDGRAVTGPGPDRGVVFQQAALFPWLTALDNVVLGIKCRGEAREVYEPKALRLLEEVGLKGFERHYPYQLSGGMQQRVQIARALAFALGQEIPLSIIYWNSNDALGKGLVADPKSGIASFRDIAKATKIAVASGTCAQVALYYMAKVVGTDYSKLNVVNLPAPLLRNALLSGSIDAGIAWAPYSVTLDAEGYRVVTWDPDYTPAGGLCPRMTGVRPAFLKAHPEIGRKLIEVDALAAAAVAENPELAIDALVKRLGLTEQVAKASMDRIYGPRPTFAQQVDPASPYSLVAKDGGLAQNLHLSLDALHQTKSIPAPIPMRVIQEAIDPSFLQAYVAASRAK